MRSLEEAEAKYLDVLRKEHPDLAEQVRRPRREERRPPRKEWRPKQTNTVFGRLELEAGAGVV